MSRFYPGATGLSIGSGQKKEPPAFLRGLGTGRPAGRRWSIPIDFGLEPARRARGRARHVEAAEVVRGRDALALVMRRAAEAEKLAKLGVVGLGHAVALQPLRRGANRDPAVSRARAA